MASLVPYTGPWTRREAAHLLRRASFGGSVAEVDAAVAAGLSSTITSLFTPLPTPAPPSNVEDGSKWVPDSGKVWTTTAVLADPNDSSTSTAYDIRKGSGFYNGITKTWWTKRMATVPASIQEKLTLFWSNHFATEMSVVQNGIFSFELLAYLRANAFGNVKSMARRVTLDAAMLRYLNGNVNTKGSPNENYARELQELFTIGKGPEVSQGDYTTYTEQDVRAAARVLTGWRDFGVRDITITGGDRDYRDNQPKNPPIFPDNPNVVFITSQHDTGDKQFSPRYGNRVIKGRNTLQGAIAELDELLDMIFEQDATAEYIVLRLYRWFVCSDINDEIRRDIIKPLAAQLRSNNYAVGPVLKTLFSSQHFFDEALRGGQLRSPADMVIGLMRAVPTWKPLLTASLEVRFYSALATSLAGQQMDLNEPSSVAGWEAYYQSPDFDRMWLTTATLPLRNGFTDALLVNNNSLGRKPILDTVAFVRDLSDANDSLRLIEQLNEIFFAVPFTEQTTMMLAEEVLMNGGRYYEWATLWNAYLAAPSNSSAFNAVRTPLDRLFKYLFRLAEFQLG
ncbi:MAG: hypothetical protein RL594_1175 [Bacteroidota bacterium]|jgi:uncharacterized protein (DUF1800 family)